MRAMTEQDRADHRTIAVNRMTHPAWNSQLREQEEATVRCILRRYPFSWLPKEHILNWIRSLESV